VDDAALLVAASDRMLPEASTAPGDFVSFQNQFIDYVVARSQQDLFYIGDLPRLHAEANPAAAARGYVHGGTTLYRASNFNALYWPHVRVPDPVGEGANPSIVIPPSGYVAGLYGRTDARRGVWKAPAGVDVTLGGVLALDVSVLDRDQDNLNPVGINALRQIPSAGLVIWGARTRQPSSEWRYVPVRRTAIFLRKSIYNGIQWAVFEPNDEPLWQTLRATISGFMETQFRNGAFAGATSKQAYFVKCDAEITNELDQAAGIVNIQVGFAPLRPAEFVVVTLSQKVGQQAQ
jgi:phage tail sheath protein FI